MRPRLFLAGLATALALAATAFLPAAGMTAGAAAPQVAASSFDVVKFPGPQPGCAGVGLRNSLYFDKLDCGFGTFALSNTAQDAVVQVALAGPGGGAPFATQQATYRTSDGMWEYDIAPAATWPAGEIAVRVSVGGHAAGGSSFFYSQLGAAAAAVERTGGYRAGDAIPVTGSIYELDSLATSTDKKKVPATYSLRVTTPTGAARGPYGPFTAGSDGTFAQTLPAAATQGLTATADTGWRTTLGLQVVQAGYDDLLKGHWAGQQIDAGTLSVSVPPTRPELVNSFVSAKGWVKPGDTYVFRLIARNGMTEAARGAVVTLPAPAGTTFTAARPVGSAGTATLTGGTVTWKLGDVPAADATGPAERVLVVEARAASLSQDPQIVWKNLSSTATMAYRGGSATSVAATSHGPKVIPPGSQYDTARYGDRPFPVVPVDFHGRAHDAAHTAGRLAGVIDDPAIAGSTFNLYQEMSFGQLFPHGTVPSAGIASSGWDVPWKSDRFRTSGFPFSALAPAGTCRGITYKDQKNTALYPQRIVNGWYQLPGDTDYYGDDKYGSALLGAEAGVGALMDIDSACGPTAKAVYDAAAIADPEIDYSDYDTDKDGVVDFFMMVFTGLGGNGDSQLNGVPSYDNIWPHSSNLEFYFTDSATGQQGYVSDDQLKDDEGRPLFYADASRAKMTTAQTSYPVYVRVGPYNVNPESAVEHASVISHEYGHSLGLPDFYSLGSRGTYGSWMLMAEDHSQNMDVFGKQELGWIVPRVLKPGATKVTGMKDGKANTHRIDWVQQDGTPYTLSGLSVANGEAYVAKLPARRIIDPAKVPSGKHLWWSLSGNDFGCAPSGGHNFDVALPELATLPSGTMVTASLKSLWDTEWDFDYGFVMVSTDGGHTYQSLPSVKGYTTPSSTNPNTNGCQSQYGNGLTGSSGSWAAGTQTVDRLTGTYADPAFVDDSYDLSSFVGKNVVLRLSYATDPGLARPGWFVDDLKVTAGSQTLYSTDFEAGADDPRIYNGGCNGTLATAPACTDGWQYLSADAGSPADHAYYMELRDRSGFDNDGHGQADRGPVGWSPGFYLMYTDEAHGYGNVGTDDPPAQTPLDARPEPGSETPNLDDAAFKAGDTYSDAGAGHTDNYTDATSADGNWHLAFDCLGFKVDAMSGDGNGPDTAPGDLAGDVSFTLGAGCGPFDYGIGKAVANAAPVAVAQVKHATVAVGQWVTFDGSLSTDDHQTPDELKYAWDYDGNGTVDSTKQTARSKYPAPGTYVAKLTVTDAGGLSDSATVTITVH